VPNLISVDWRGAVYDCDFNQMLDLRSGSAQAGACICRSCSIKNIAGGQHPCCRA